MVPWGLKCEIVAFPDHTHLHLIGLVSSLISGCRVRLQQQQSVSFLVLQSS